jgi:PTS system nitrogen regulatory IIA component
MRISPDKFAAYSDEDSELPLLADALSAGSVLYDVEGTTNAEVLKSLVDRLVLPPEADREYLYQILVAREALGSTGIGKGIAIPHVRNPVVLHVAEPSVTLCFLKQPIDFKAIDGIPVSILFTIISPTVRSHLHLLSRIAFVLRDPDVLSTLDRRGSPEEIFSVLAAAENRIPETK